MYSVVDECFGCPLRGRHEMIVTHAGEEDILAETVLTLDTEEDSEEKAAGDLTPDLDQVCTIQ